MRTYTLLWAIGLVLLPSTQAQDTLSVPFDPGPVIATVDGTPITREFYERSFLRHLQVTGAPDDTTQRYQHLANLIDQVLLAEEAQQRNLDEADAYARFVAVREKQALNALYLYAGLIDTLSTVGDAEVRQAYARTQERRAVRQLFFTNEAEAQRYHARLEAGADFVDLANELYDTATYDTSAGDLGYLSYFDIDDAFAEAAWNLDVGAYSAPVRTRQGYVILRVDGRAYNPLLTEYAYQYRRRKTTALAQQRRLNLEGDAWVRAEMASAAVTPSIEGIRLVFERLREIAGRYPDAASRPVQLTEAETAPLRATLSPDTPLATYRVGDSLRTFTAADYLAWLPLLPFDEALHRTVPSVGRALRYEVFAARARAQGLDRDPWLAFNTAYVSTFYLADQVLDVLDPAFQQPLPDSLAPGLIDDTRTEADFWTVRAASETEARWIRDAIASGEQQPDEQVRYLAYEAADVTRNDAFPHLAPHIRRAPLGTPVLVHTGRDWYVMEVARRTTAPVSPSEQQARLRELGYHYHLQQYLQALRDDAVIDIDRDALHATMAHYADPALQLP